MKNPADLSALTNPAMKNTNPFCAALANDTISAL
jgi:hypothetical protein